jgi:hypothetical protein
MWPDHASEAKRRSKCKALLSQHVDNFSVKVVFFDEPFFVLRLKLIAQNDRVYGANFEDVLENIRAVQPFQNESSVVVWAGFSKRGKLPLVFIKKGVKINSKFYLDEILQMTVQVWAPVVCGDDWIFQQDSAPAHSAKICQQWCENNFPCFISCNE